MSRYLSRHGQGQLIYKIGGHYAVRGKTPGEMGDGILSLLLKMGDAVEISLYHFREFQTLASSHDRLGQLLFPDKKHIRRFEVDIDHRPGPAKEIRFKIAQNVDQAGRDGQKGGGFFDIKIGQDKLAAMIKGTAGQMPKDRFRPGGVIGKVSEQMAKSVEAVVT